MARSAEIQKGSKTLRCAIYTRKSSEEGLEQDVRASGSRHQRVIFDFAVPVESESPVAHQAAIAAVVAVLIVRVAAVRVVVSVSGVGVDD